MIWRYKKWDLPPGNERKIAGLINSNSPLTRTVFKKKSQWIFKNYGMHFVNMNSLYERVNNVIIIDTATDFFFCVYIQILKYIFRSPCIIVLYSLLFNVKWIFRIFFYIFKSITKKINWSLQAQPLLCKQKKHALRNS